MKKKNSKFQELVKKIETLQENETGLLKGGFSSFAAVAAINTDTNTNCPQSGNCL